MKNKILKIFCLFFNFSLRSSIFLAVSGYSLRWIKWLKQKLNLYFWGKTIDYMTSFRYYWHKIRSLEVINILSFKIKLDTLVNIPIIIFGKRLCKTIKILFFEMRKSFLETRYWCKVYSEYLMIFFNFINIKIL